MQIHLVIPGLIWPTPHATAPSGSLALPGLERLLGLGERTALTERSSDAALARLFGLHSDALPYAALRRLGEQDGAEQHAGHDWLCADPVHLQFAREHLLLTELDDSEIDQQDADALLAALNDSFADIGRFEAPAPRRWYLKLAAPTEAALFPLTDVVGRPIAHFLPEGRDARLWQRTMNEVQIVLHNHALNQAREDRGLRSLNSLWFWGPGRLPERATAPCPTVLAADPLSVGLARLAGLTPQPPRTAAGLAGDTLVVLDALQRPALQLDLDSWREALAGLERDWFAPLAALPGGKLHRLRITAPGDRAGFELDVRAGQRWKFWRKPQALDALLKQIVPPPQRPEAPPGAMHTEHGHP
ncbi:hypothetical protein dqs_1629 [Azoarcus olearius]|uniref:hypothetical protein n=1 Tax=Azoarcus sp. (strain BH72) TaxID=418699 RepID=UPI0008062604|nr:hypothetical protein [Azoarcus olearius]ANQ84673.1 hypothetical protein dqs_1629 [Azoarcus olearius]